MYLLFDYSIYYKVWQEVRKGTAFRRFSYKGRRGESFVFRFIDSESGDLATYPNRRKKPAGEPAGRFSEDQEGRMVTVG